MKDAPHDCILRIQNVNRSDVGEYQCVGHLPISGKFEHASSNFENLTLYQNQSSPSLPGINVPGIAVAGGFVAILLLVVTVRVCVMIRKRCNPVPNPEIHPPPPPRSHGHANTQAAIQAADPPSK